MNKKPQYGKNLKLAFFFTVGILIIIVLSLLWKLSVLISQSKYDGKHQFNLAIDTRSPRVVSFSPENGSVSILVIQNENDIRNVGKDASIPIDAYIKSDIPTDSVGGILSDSIIHFKKNANINLIDKIKLWWLLKSTHGDMLSIDTVSLPISDSVYTDTIAKMFLDKTIYQEAKTIEVINATGDSGYGSRLARLISNIGGDVVMVATSPKTIPSSSITYNDLPSYTEERISNSIHIPGQEVSSRGTAIADIIITIGEDKINTNDF